MAWAKVSTCTDDWSRSKRHGARLFSPFLVTIHDGSLVNVAVYKILDGVDHVHGAIKWWALFEHNLSCSMDFHHFSGQLIGSVAIIGPGMFLHDPAHFETSLIQISGI